MLFNAVRDCAELRLWARTAHLINRYGFSREEWTNFVREAAPYAFWDTRPFIKYFGTNPVVAEELIVRNAERLLRTLEKIELFLPANAVEKARGEMPASLYAFARTHIRSATDDEENEEDEEEEEAANNELTRQTADAYYSLAEAGRGCSYYHGILKTVAVWESFLANPGTYAAAVLANGDKKAYLMVLAEALESRRYYYDNDTNQKLFASKLANSTETASLAGGGAETNA